MDSMSQIRPSTQIMQEDPDGTLATIRARALAELPALLALESDTQPRTPQQINEAITVLAKGLTAVIRLELEQLDTASGT